MFGSITHQSYLAYSSNPEIDIFNSRAVIQSVERPYATFSFRVVCISVHKMVYRKGSATCLEP